MKLYLIFQTVNDGYDTYDSAVVCAATEDEARAMHPNGEPGGGKYGGVTWAAPDAVTVKEIGTALEGIEEPSVVCASFNAG